MKKMSLIIIVLFTMNSIAFSQVYNHNNILANVGIGFGSTLTGDGLIPPISLSAEMGYNENISVGGYFAYASTEEKFSSFTYSYNHLILGARGSYHFYNEDNLNAYGGLMLGYNIVSSSIEGDSDIGSSADAGGFTYSFYLGSRYMFSDSIGAFAELGYGISYVNLGLTLKM